MMEVIVEEEIIEALEEMAPVDINGSFAEVFDDSEYKDTTNNGEVKMSFIHT